VAINPETGTAHDGQLWTEENLPAESVLVSVVEEHIVQKSRPSEPGGWLNSIAETLLKRPIQLGGKATVGRGRCDLHLIPADGRA
jgi:CRISPR-associated protein Cmr4